MSLSQGCWWMALATATATKNQAGPKCQSRWHAATATLSAPAPQALCPGHRRRELRRAHHAAQSPWQLMSPVPRLINETGLAQESGGGRDVQNKKN